MGTQNGESLYFRHPSVCEGCEPLVYNAPFPNSMLKRTNTILDGQEPGRTHCRLLRRPVPRYPDQWTGFVGLSAAFEAGKGIESPPNIVFAILDTVTPFLATMPLKRLFDEELIVSDLGALQAWRGYFLLQGKDSLGLRSRGSALYDGIVLLVDWSRTFQFLC